MKKSLLSILFTGFLIIAIALLLSAGKKSSDSKENNVSIVDGKQIIEITAKGGYQPKLSIAKADLPTVLKIDTRGTFDCSSALVIPAFGYRTNLPPSGTTEVELPPQTAGTTVQGLCAMGMYNFEIQFN